jgi:hypothetical protein
VSSLRKFYNKAGAQGKLQRQVRGRALVRLTQLENQLLRSTRITRRVNSSPTNYVYLHNCLTNIEEKYNRANRLIWQDKGERDTEAQLAKTMHNEEFQVRVDILRDEFSNIYPSVQEARSALQTALLTPNQPSKHQNTGPQTQLQLGKLTFP